MKPLQPIEWVVNGKTHKGIVTEILSNKGGVIARSVDNPGEAVMVPDPHKIRDLKEMTAIWKALGIKPEAAVEAGYIDSKPKPKVVVKGDDEVKGAFEKALAEIEAACDPNPEKGTEDKKYMGVWRIATDPIAI